MKKWDIPSVARLQRLRHWQRPALLGALVLAMLWADFLTGPRIHLPIIFAIPVVLATWLYGRRMGFVFAVLLPAARLGFNFLWDAPLHPTELLINLVIRVAALLVLAYLVWYLQHFRRPEIRESGGLHMQCCFCRRHRMAREVWPVIRIPASQPRDIFQVCEEPVCPTCASLYSGHLRDSEA